MGMKPVVVFLLTLLPYGLAVQAEDLVPDGNSLFLPREDSFSFYKRQTLQICHLEPTLKEKLMKLRFSKGENSAAIVMKIQTDKLLIVEDEEYEDVTLGELQEDLPEHVPRYVVYKQPYRQGGRVSYALIFIFISPLGVKPEEQMMYAGSKLSVVKALGLTKVFEVRSVEEMTDEWLRKKLRFFRL